MMTRALRLKLTQGGGALAFLLGCGFVSPAFAVDPAAAAGIPTVVAGAASEVVRLRAELDRKTAEISALKRIDRSVRQDYELRQRMAEANELARRLTVLENQTGQGRPVAPAAPIEGAAALAARADMLTDEAQKLAERAAGMVRAAGQLRTKQTLRRRAAAVERDPFASVEGSKRLIFVRGSTNLNGRNAAPASGQESAGSNVPPGAGPGAGSPTPMMPMPTSGNPALAPTAPPPGGGGTAPAGGSPPPPPPGGGPEQPTSGPSSSPPPATPGSAPAPQPVSDSNFGANQAPNLRPELAPAGQLDPSLRAQVAGIEAGQRAGTATPEALERAAATLSDRARELERQAAALRARAAQR